MGLKKLYLWIWKEIGNYEVRAVNCFFTILKISDFLVFSFLIFDQSI